MAPPGAAGPAYSRHSHGDAAMIVGIGVDVLDMARMERELARDDEAFVEQLFSPAEIAYCRMKAHPARHFAARFAVKEAVFKALGTGALDAGAWREVELFRGANAQGRVVLHGRLKEEAARRGVRRICVSISATRDQVVANVVLESAEVRRVEV